MCCQQKEVPTQQATNAMQGLMAAQQQDEEDLADCCKQFMSINEMVEWVCGEIAPLVIAKEEPNSLWKGS